ncbi:tungsten-dependent formylmethanofuran dehydrogenase subunit FwdF [Methanococcus maripaludis]|uniref:4Fe-4S ferredoxin n=1 Tax=Methanococcus maripaludis TaxID=39152 RepID=A0A7J9PS46_METMI|nr:tungsten-dependent formylmethanofuran dehydrogenase subunit FwdF [Methanococcus maripaludis]MBA2868328.1 4Fe-4S ferredoxin [Methanococcus maripaludis]
MKNFKKDENDGVIEISRSGVEKRVLKWDDCTCVGCGICSEICPTSAIEMGPLGAIFKGDIDAPKLDISEKCVLCGMCACACPFDAVKLSINDKPITEMPQYPKIKRGIELNQSKCVLCEQCELVCPQCAIDVEREVPERKSLVLGEITIKKDDCVLCGICAEYCPADAIELIPNDMNALSLNPIADINIDLDACVYCKVCEKACPHNAIEAICYKCPLASKIKKPELYGEIKGQTNIDKDLCVSCGWCANICPAEAIEVEKPFEGELIIDEPACNACGACISVCPCNALVFPQPTKQGEKVPNVVVNQAVCILCGACTHSCPVDALTVKRTKINMTEANAPAWKKAFSKLMK